MAKVKFGQRIARAFAYGIGLGTIYSMIMYSFTKAINILAIQSGLDTVINEFSAILLGFGLGISLALGIEMSKEMSE